MTDVLESPPTPIGPAVSVQRAIADSAIARTRVLGDAFDRYIRTADGTVYKGPGSAQPTLAGGFALSGGGSVPVNVRTPGDGLGDGLWNVNHNGGPTEPYVFHLGVTGTSGAAIGIGVSPSVVGPAGILVDNYTKGIGIILQQMDTISSAQAVGFYGVTNQALAPLMVLTSSVASPAPLLIVKGGPVGAGHLMEWLWNSGASQGGWFDGLDGSLNWVSEIRPTGGNPTLHLLQTGAGAGLNSEGYWGIFGQKYHAAAGSVDGGGNTFFYTSDINLQTDEIHFRVCAAPAIKGAETMMDVITCKGAFFSGLPKLGFYGAVPVAKPTGVAVTAAGVHAALVSLGLIAA